MTKTNVHIANLVRVSPSTIERWLAGESAPMVFSPVLKTLVDEIERLRAYIAQRQWEHAADSAHEHCPAPSAPEHLGTGDAVRCIPGNEGAIPSGAADTTTLAGMRRYIFQQLGFLTDDDNRPAEGLIRLAAKRLRGRGIL